MTLRSGSSASHWRTLERFLESLLLVVVVVFQGCVVHEDKCSRNTECSVTGGGFCAKSGFCKRECVGDGDCPCGSVCGQRCGICLRVDFAGPATCFPYREGLSTEEVLGTCRDDIDSRQVSAPTIRDALVDADIADVSDADATNGTCDLKPVSLPLCVQSPPLDAGMTPSDTPVVEASAPDTIGDSDESTDGTHADAPSTTGDVGPEGASLDAAGDDAMSDMSAEGINANLQGEP